MAEFKGTAGDDTLTGTISDDIFHLGSGGAGGAAGEDTATGLDGTDTFYFTGAFDAGDSIDGGTGADRVVLDADYSAGVVMSATTLINVEDLQLDGHFNYNLTSNDATVAAGQLLHVHGNAGQIIFDGSAETNGSFQLDGTDGGDTLIGGGGNDTISGKDGDDHITGGAGNDTLTGEDGNDVISDSSGTNTLAGGNGDDTLTGGTGNDTLIGKFGNDTLIAGSGTENLDGGLGDDIVFAGTGVDTLTGGSGDDTVNFTMATSALTTSLHLSGSYTLAGGGSGTLNSFDTIIGTSFGDTITLTGDTGTVDGSGGDDVLTGIGSRLGFITLKGGDGDDHLIGGRYHQILNGGRGDDILQGDHHQDTASYEDANGGITIDMRVHTAQGVGADQGTDTLINIQNLTGTAFADHIIGGNDNNIINGGDGDDYINGEQNKDTMNGGDGNDTLDGGTRADVLTGGAGADTFVFESHKQLASEYTGDRITDFSHAQGDQIDLHQIDADSVTPGDQAFHLGGAVFTHSAGELIQVVTGGNTVVSGDLNGDGSADFTITLNGAPTLVAGDFIL